MLKFISLKLSIPISFNFNKLSFLISSLSLGIGAKPLITEFKYKPDPPTKIAVFFIFFKII